MNTLSHIAIIMDGNGRWAKKKNKSRNFGHKMGLSNIKNIIHYCMQKKVKFLTLYAFSFDNWKRSKNEISYLFKLLDNYLKKDLKYLIENKIRIKVVGEKKKLNKILLSNFKKIETVTSVNYDITVLLAFNYSSKLEILNSFKKMIKKEKKITTDSLSKHLYTSFAPDPEILVRTGGYNRLSDFLLWQIAYTEIFFIKKLWPDFKSTDLNLIINKYKNIQRNFGSLNE